MSKSADSNTEKPDTVRRVPRAETSSLSPEMLKRPQPTPPPDKTPPKKESK